MKSVNTKETEKKELKEAFALWENKNDKITYYTGKTSDEKNPIRLVAFLNVVKKNPNAPDLVVYESGDKDSKERNEIASLWEATSKAGKQYFTGATNEKGRVVAFVIGNTPEGK